MSHRILPLMLLLACTGCRREAPSIDSSHFLAARMGQISEIWTYLEHDGNVGATDVRGKTLLHWAAIGGQQAMAQLLLQRGAPINARDNARCTPLYYAIEQGRFEVDPTSHIKVAQLLISSGADVNLPDIVRRTPLHAAVKLGGIQLVKQLASRGADLDAAGKNSPPPLLDSVGKPEIAWLLVTSGANLNAKGPNGGTALHEAARKGDEEVARMLLDRGADRAIKDYEGYTPWQRAQQAGHHALAKMLR